MTRYTAIILLLGVALAGGCKSQDGARKDDSNKAYVPPPPPPPSQADATPAPADDRVDEDASLAQCVRECVQQSQMNAESPESIRAGCVSRCTEQCVSACIERADRRGGKDDKTATVCQKSCVL